MFVKGGFWMVSSDAVPKVDDLVGESDKRLLGARGNPATPVVVGRTHSVGTSDVCVGGRRAYGVSNPASVAGVRDQRGHRTHRRHPCPESLLRGHQR